MTQYWTCEYQGVKWERRISGYTRDYRYAYFVRPAQRWIYPKRGSGESAYREDIPEAERRWHFGGMSASLPGAEAGFRKNYCGEHYLANGGKIPDHAIVPVGIRVAGKAATPDQIEAFRESGHIPAGF